MPSARYLALVALALGACTDRVARTDSERSAADPTSAPVAGEQVALLNTEASEYTTTNLPRWAYTVLRDGGYLQRYELFLQLNPFFQSGLFDGDSLVDVAVQITDRNSGKRGIALIHRGDKSVHVLGVGTAFGNGGDDFSWIWQWSTEDRDILQDSLAIGRQALYVGKGDSAGGMIWWNGSMYVWTQWGD